MLLDAGVVDIMASFTIVVAPTAFKVLPQEWARLYVRAFPPKYYAFLAFATALAVYLASESTTMAIFGVCASLFIFLLILTPRINQVLDLGKPRVFDVLDGTNVLINLAQMAVLLGVLWIGA
jgi:Domain of unknown function (DUF4149)